jgi:N-acetylmuramoyl-L-alanine amidase
MPDKPTPEDQPRRPSDEEVPASVTFMEMMRRAAAKSAPPQPNPAEQLFRRRVDMQNSPADAASSPARPAFTHDEERQAAAMEEQRIRRLKRRRARRRRQTVGMLGGMLRSFMVVTIAAGLMATLFTWLTPPQFLTSQVKSQLSYSQSGSLPTLAPTPMPTPNWLRRIGIVSGHRGPQVPPDPGAVCPDGLTEASINFAVAQKVVENLRARGYAVDMLDEFDPRLDGYQAAALVSIHANTCQDFGEPVSGFLVASAASRRGAQGNDEVLVNCLAKYYTPASGLNRRDELTRDMTDYHSFREIHPLTPAAIIELGFLLGDRDVLTNKQPDLAQGITNGILCFLEPSSTQSLDTK